jgi:hypothetical protein
VGHHAGDDRGLCCGAGLEAAHSALAEAEKRQRLPDDYTDITEGLFASVKRRIKRKLLGNFKQAYVDVLSRQQSAFNRHILAALQELAECAALLDHAAATGSRSLAAQTQEVMGGDKVEGVTALLQSLLAELAENRRRVTALEARLERLEARRFRKKRHSDGGSRP